MDPAAFHPHGLAMLAYHNGDHDAVIVVEDDYGERDEFPVEYFFRGADQFQDYEQMAVDLCRGRVLDVGAGSGCHTLYLQDGGFDVVALDIVPESVEVLCERGAKDARCVQISEFRGETFDTILLLMNGIGLAETLDGVGPMLEHLTTLLNPGGQVLADSTDVRLAYGADVAPNDDLLRLDGRYMGEITFQLQYESTKGPPFPQLYVDPVSLDSRARDVGWQMEVLQQSPHGGYLARLTPPN